MADIAYDRRVLTTVLIYHQPTATSGCHCGWGVLGASHAEHVADEYERAMSDDSDSARPDEGSTSQRIIADELERNFGRLFAWQADRIIEALRDKGYAITREALCARSGGCRD